MLGNTPRFQKGTLLPQRSLGFLRKRTLNSADVRESGKLRWRETLEVAEQFHSKLHTPHGVATQAAFAQNMIINGSKTCWDYIPYLELCFG